MLRTIAYTQLDPATKAYLRAVRQSGGRGAPGVFHATSDARAIIALLVGLIVAPVFVCMGYGTNKAPWAMAMLQTAGVMTGGWLVLYAFRRWFAGLDNYAGKFVYFDPEYVFVGRGEELQYARLGDDPSAEPAGDSGVRFGAEGGQFVVPVPARSVALFVADYYDALSHLRRDAEGSWWSEASPAELGAMARYMVVNERVPSSMSEVTLEIEDVPEEVRPARGRPSGVLRYLLILAVGGLVYAGFTFTNKPLHDEGAFAAVNQTSPAELRHYLADPHTSAHHDEAKKKLADLYAAKRKELGNRVNTDAEIRDAFLTLFGTLDGPEPPAVSIAVADRSDNPNGGSWANSLRTRLADGIGTEVGKEYIVFVQKPDDPGRWPLVDLSYGTDAGGKFTWTLAFRQTPTDETPYATFTRVLGEVNVTPSEAVYTDVMKKLLGNAPAAPPPLPVGDDDW